MVMKIKLNHDTRPHLSMLLNRRAQSLPEFMDQMGLKDAEDVATYCRDNDVVADIPIARVRMHLPVTSPEPVSVVVPVVEEEAKPSKKKPRPALVELPTDEKKPD